MSEEAKKVIQTVKQGNLPPLSQQNNSSSKGLQSSQRGLNKSTFGLQPINEGTQLSRNGSKNK